MKLIPVGCMKGFVHIISLAALVFASCSRYDKAVCTALRYAGGNRSELEKVLDHYSRTDRNPLKYKAAEYLIGNMTYHLSYPDSLYQKYASEVDSLFVNQTDEDSCIVEIEKISDKYISCMKPQYDIKTISADYLIWNIDYSFDLWHTSKFLSYLDFNDFCEYVLPYKCVELQPVNKWKETYSGKHRGDLDLLEQFADLQDNSRVAVEATQVNLKNSIVRGIQVFNCIPLVDMKALEHLGIATCRERAVLGLMNSRSKGLPVSLDMTPIWADRTSPHYWNNLYYGLRNNIYYDPIFSRLGVAHNLDHPCSKIYRYSYKPEPVLLDAKSHDPFFPEELSNIFVRDVTSEYGRTQDIEIKLESSGCKYAYLCTSEGDSWHPVTVSRVRRGKASYNDIGVDILYLIVAYDESGVQKPLSKPFIVDKHGNIKRIEADMDTTVNMVIRRKYPAFQHIFNIKDRLGRFVIENSEDGEEYSVQGISPDKKFLAGSIVVQDSTAKQYWGLRPYPGLTSELAEVYFYEKHTGMQLHPSVVATGDISDENGNIPFNLFDRKPLTNYALCPESMLVLDFGKPVSIGHISYIKRGDGNDICPGETYELYYWADRWILHDTKEASDVFVEFDGLPANALYYIRCTTSGTQNRIFIYRKGEVEWY